MLDVGMEVIVFVKYESRMFQSVDFLCSLLYQFVFDRPKLKSNLMSMYVCM